MRSARVSPVNLCPALSLHRSVAARGRASAAPRRRQSSAVVDASLPVIAARPRAPPRLSEARGCACGRSDWRTTHPHPPRPADCFLGKIVSLSFFRAGLRARGGFSRSKVAILGIRVLGRETPDSLLRVLLVQGCFGLMGFNSCAFSLLWSASPSLLSSVRDELFGCSVSLEAI